MRNRKIILMALVVVGIAATLLVHLNREHEFIATISFTHRLQLSLRAYVQDHGQFPESLEEMRRDQNLNATSLSPPFGGFLQYDRPSTNSPASRGVLLVTYRGREIVVTKDFTRRP
jgi:hypothetical protein